MFFLSSVNMKVFSMEGTRQERITHPCVCTGSSFRLHPEHEHHNKPGSHQPRHHLIFCAISRIFMFRLMYPLQAVLLNHISEVQLFSESLTSFFFFLRFQSERESGDRNFAIGYYLKEKKVGLSCLLYFEDCGVLFFFFCGL